MQIAFSSSSSWMENMAFYSNSTDVPESTIDHMLTLVMTWHRPGNKTSQASCGVSLGNTLHAININMSTLHAVITFNSSGMCAGTWADHICHCLHWQHVITKATSNGSWCIGIKGEMSGTVCVTFTWDIYIYIYIWVVFSFCLFCCLFIIVTWWYMWCIVWQVASKRKYRHVW